MAKGWSKQNHKYKNKRWENGHWVYDYNWRTNKSPGDYGASAARRTLANANSYKQDSINQHKKATTYHRAADHVGEVSDRVVNSKGLNTFHNRMNRRNSNKSKAYSNDYYSKRSAGLYKSYENEAYTQARQAGRAAMADKEHQKQLKKNATKAKITRGKNKVNQIISNLKTKVRYKKKDAYIKTRELQREGADKARAIYEEANKQYRLNKTKVKKKVNRGYKKAKNAAANQFTKVQSAYKAYKNS